MIINGERVDKVKYVHVRGAIFFSSTRKFVNMFHIGEDPDTVVLDFKDAIVIDHSAVAAIQGLTHRYALAGKLVIILNISKKCVGRMHRTHGDRDKLHDQMSYAVEDIEGQQNGGGIEKDVVDDISKNGGDDGDGSDRNGDMLALQDLAMFQADVDGGTMDKAIEKLGQENRYSVQSVVEKKE